MRVWLLLLFSPLSLLNNETFELMDGERLEKTGTTRPSRDSPGHENI